MVDNKNLFMMAAVGEALKYQKANPSFGHEEVLKHIMRSSNLKQQDKLLAIAAVSKALDYKERKPRSTDKEIIQHLMSEVSKIEIDEE
jgi:phosphomannomutase